MQLDLVVDPAAERVAALFHPGGRDLHKCDRHCSFSPLFGNAWRCDTSGSTHCCDANCAQRIFYDSHSTICRLSKRVFPNAPGAGAPGGGGERKRAAGEAPPLARAASRAWGSGSVLSPDTPRDEEAFARAMMLG
jgi:hypothetical protein